MKIFGIGIVAFLLFLVELLVYKLFWDKNLKVSMFFKQDGISEGEYGEILEVIENRKRLPLNMLKVKFQTSRNLGFLDDIGSKTTDQYYRNDVFQVGAEEKITRTLRFQGKKRGYYRINNIDLVASDLFFMNEFVKSMSTEQYLYVYPRVFKSEVFRLSLQKLNGEILVKRHMLEDPFEYRGIREYQPFDDIRSVNWKATARTGELKVNQKNYTAMQTIRIFLNLEDNGIWKKDKEVEASMQIVMGLASFFLAQGIKISCYSNVCDILNDEVIEVQGISGIGQIDVLGKAFARADITKIRPFFDLYRDVVLEEKDELFTFFVSPNGYTEFTELMKECKRQGLDCCWLYPKRSYEQAEVPEEIKKLVQFISIDEML